MNESIRMLTAKEILDGVSEKCLADYESFHLRIASLNESYGQLMNHVCNYWDEVRKPEHEQMNRMLRNELEVLIAVCLHTIVDLRLYKDGIRE